MENNNQTEVNNQQVMTNNKNNKTVLIILIALIILGLAGYIVYTKVIQKNDNPKPNDTQESNNSNEDDETNDISHDIPTNVVGLTYKTKDGKKTLKIGEKSGEIYLAEYNGKDLDIYEFYNYDKYGVFVGDKSGNSSQCGEYYLVVNNQTKELMDLEYGNSKGDEGPFTYTVKKIGNNYYFIKGVCYYIYSNDAAVYNENLSKIADEFITLDKNNNFYATKDGYITKFDSNGKELKHGSIKPDSKYGLALDGASIINDNFYAVIEVNSKLYIYDFDKDNKIELNNPYKSYLCPSGDCAAGVSVGTVGKKLLIILHPVEEQEKLYQNDITYLFDPSNSKLDSIGSFITWDDDKEFGNGNFYLYDYTSLYKYDNNGNLVTKTEFDYNKVVETDVTGGFVAYKGNLFVVIKENGEYYLQDAFNKDKYKIDMVDGYEFYCVELVSEYKDGKFVTTNIIELSLTKKDDPNDGGSIKYKFNIDTKKMSK